MPYRSCKACEFFREVTQEDSPNLLEGECRRYPPIFPGIDWSEFPQVLGEYECGEFKQSEYGGRDGKEN